MKIIDYQPEYQVYFKDLNLSWLEEYFTVEPFDQYAFDNPEEAILKDGGRIIFAENEGEILGTVALKYAGPGVFEMAKMAVRKDARGMGTGKLLCNAIIEIAANMHAEKLILYSSKKLKPAIAMYLKLGFAEIPLEPGLYKRADIKMELVLKPKDKLNIMIDLKQFSREWIEAWNDHDIEKILSHYSGDIEFYSPIIKQLGTNSEGVIKDKATLKDYFTKALALYPDLFFTLHEILIGTDSLILFYTSVNGKKSAEFMQFNKEGKINFVRAHYN